MFGSRGNSQSTYGHQAAPLMDRLTKPANGRSAGTRRARKMDDGVPVVKAANEVRRAVTPARFAIEDRLLIGASLQALLGRGDKRADAKQNLKEMHDARATVRVIRHYPTISGHNAHRLRVVKYAAGAALIGGTALGIVGGVTPDTYPGVSTIRNDLADMLATSDHSSGGNAPTPSDILPSYAPAPGGAVQGPVVIPAPQPS